MKYQRLLALTLIAVASTGLTLLGERMGDLSGVNQLKYRTLDWRQWMTSESLLPGIGTRESPITLVFFDEFAVTDSLSGWNLWEQPFPRSIVADAIDAVAGAGARTIGLDVYLQKRYPGLNVIDRGDELLHDAIQRAGNVVLVGPVEQTDSGPVFRAPDPYFADVAAAVSAADLPPVFGTARDGALAVRSGETLEPSFALALLGQAEGMDVDSLLLEARRVGRVALPGLPSTGGWVPERWWREDAQANDFVVSFPIRFVGPPSSADATDPLGTFPAVSSSTVASTAMFMPELFQDKVVLIGSGFHDSDKFRTPFYGVAPDEDPADAGDTRTYEWMYGVEIHANALQNMLDREFIRPFSYGHEILLLLLVSLLTGGAAFWKGAGWGGAATVACLAVLGVVAFWLWAGKAYGPGGTYFAMGSRFLWVPLVTPTMAGVLSYVGSVGYVSVVEGKEKRFIKGAFGKYLSPEVVEELIEHPELLELGGSRRSLTLLFSDLAGFTTLSERMDPQDLLAHLNEYLEDMTQMVLDSRGYLDKYIGDAIMAFWNAPVEVADHADRALRVAVLMQRKMADLNGRWRERDPDAEELVVRIGINTGPVVVGNMGGENKQNYSAIGDAVNLAARLEPANKSYDTLVMASQFTLDAADRAAFRYRELDLIAVKGKIEPVTVYEILELADVALPAHREEALRHYDAGLKAYKARAWSVSATHFEAALAADPRDGPSRVYLERAREYTASPPAPNWDFVVRRTVK